MTPRNTDDNNLPVHNLINRGHILALPAILIMPLTMYASKGISVLFVVSALAAFVWGRFYKQPLQWPSTSFMLPFAAFNIYAVLTSIWSPTSFVSLKSSLSLCLITFGGFVLVTFAKNLEPNEKKVLAYALAFGAAISLFLFGIEILSDDAIWRWIDAVKTGLSDTSTPNNKMLFFNSAMSVAALFIWPLFLLWSGKWRVLAIIGALLTVMILFLSEADTPSLAILLGALTSLLFWGGRAVMPVLLGCAVIILVVMAPLIPGLFPGPATIRAEMPYLSNSAIHRIMIWKVATKHIAEDPVFGIGMNTTRSLYDKKTKKLVSFPASRPEGRAWSNYFEPIPLHPHNATLQVWLELGGFGIAGLVWIIVTLIRAAGRYRGQPLIMGFGVSSLVIANLSFGAWQSWWVCTMWLCSSLLVSQLPSMKDK